MMYDAVLENARVVYSEEGFGFVLVGRVYADTKNRFEDGYVIHTSEVRQIHPYTDRSVIVVTQNTTYRVEGGFRL